MNANVIDTLRYADRLKEAGVEAGQAEAMSRALNAELTQGLATKPDLDKTEQGLGARIDKVEQGLGARIDESGQRLDARIDRVEQELGTRIDELGQRLDTRIDQVDQKLGARIDELGQRLDARIDLVEQKLGGRIDALASQFATQNRYVFLTLTLIAGLGLYNAIAPRFAEKASAPTPAAPQPVAERNASDD